MSRYRKIHIRMWGDEKFRRLSAPKPNAQTLWIYLLTGTHTGPIPGLSHVGEAALVEAIGWSTAAFRKHFSEITAAGMAKADWDARVLWLPNAMRCNQPENTNVLRGWVATLADIPECELRREAESQMADFSQDLGEAFAKAFDEAFRKAFGKAFTKGRPKEPAKQEYESDIESERGKASPSEPPSTQTAFKIWWCGLVDARGRGPATWRHGQNKDDGIAESLRQAFNGRSDELVRRAEAFLADNDPWIIERGHTLAIFHSRIQRYAPRPEPKTAVPDPNQTQAMLDEIYGRKGGAA